MISLATIVITGQASGLLDGVQYGPPLGSSLQYTWFAILFATHFDAFAWTKRLGVASPPAWLPLAVGAGSLVTVILLWRALLVSEAAHLTERTHVAASATRAAVIRQLTVPERTLRRMSRDSRAPDEMWTSLASQLIADVPGVQSVIWADSNGHRLGSDTRSTPADLQLVLGTLQRNASSVRVQGDVTVFLPFAADSSRAVMVVPRCDKSGCTDLFVAVLRAPGVFGAILGETILGYDMAIGSGGRCFFASGTPPAVTDPLFVREPVLTSAPAWELASVHDQALWR